MGVQLIHFQLLTTTMKIFFSLFSSKFSCSKKCPIFASSNGKKADDGTTARHIIILFNAQKQNNMETTIEIKSVYGDMIFSHTAENNSIKLTVEEAVKKNVCLTLANLAGANLAGANLTGAKLSWANLAGANLSNTNLSWVNLTDAHLEGTNLQGVKLYRTILDGANF